LKTSLTFIFFFLTFINLEASQYNVPLTTIMGDFTNYESPLDEDYHFKFDPTLNALVNDNCPPELNLLAKDSLDQGIQCLKKLDTKEAKKIYKNFSQLLIDRNLNLKINCPEKLKKEDTMAFTFIENREIFFQNSKIDYIHVQQGVPFHEYMHILGYTHPHIENNLYTIDKVITCDACCFNIAGYVNSKILQDPSFKRLACNFCSGKSKNIDVYQTWIYALKADSKSMDTFNRLEIDKIYNRIKSKIKKSSLEKIILEKIKDIKDQELETKTRCDLIYKKFPHFNRFDMYYKSKIKMNLLYPGIFNITDDPSQLLNCKKQ
jgi:hypothetical protein